MPEYVEAMQCMLDMVFRHFDYKGSSTLIDGDIKYLDTNYFVPIGNCFPVIPSSQRNLMWFRLPDKPFIRGWPEATDTYSDVELQYHISVGLSPIKSYLDANPEKINCPNKNTAVVLVDIYNLNATPCGVNIYSLPTAILEWAAHILNIKRLGTQHFFDTYWSSIGYVSHPGVYSNHLFVNLY